MSAQISNNSFANIGRMFARQNVPSVYGSQKATAAAVADEAARVDNVTLSAFAPKPLTADFLEDAISTGNKLGDGESASNGEKQRMREDRIFAAMCALTLIGYTGEGGMPATWPGGIPVPTSEELETARRRLAQRPSDPEKTENPEQLQQDRLELLQKLSKQNFSEYAVSA